MAVAFDSVGPSAAGSQGGSPRSYTHTTIAASTVVVVGAQLDGVAVGAAATCTIGGVTATLISTVAAGAGGTTGICKAWYLAGVGSGAHTIVVTCSTAADIACGSMAYSGAAQVSTAFTAQSATTGTTASVAVTPTTSGNMVAGFVACGDVVNSTTQTSRWVNNVIGGAGQATGNGAGADAASTGSTVTMSWAVNVSPWAVIAVEVQGAGTPPVAGARNQPGGRVWQRRYRRAQQPFPQQYQTPVLNVQAGLATAAGAAQSPSFPLYITGLAGGTSGYFTDQHGSPRLYFATVPWGMPANAGRWNSGNWQLDFDTYFADIKAQGMTAAEMHPWGHSHTGCNNDIGNTWDSVSPWTTIPTLNSTFWARIDYLLNSALAQGITVFLNLTMQCDLGDDAFAGTGVFNGTSASTMQTAAQNIAARYASQPNLIYMFGDDYNNNDDTRLGAVLTGLRAGGYSGPVSIEYYSSGTTSRRDLSGSPTGTQFAWGGSNANFNWCYYYMQTYFAVEQAYKENSQVPVVWGDGTYVGGGAGEPADNHIMRNMVWWALASGARGVSMGSEVIHPWPSGIFTVAVDGITTNAWYNTSALHVYTVFSGLGEWYNLLPDTANSLVTAGRGTRAAYSNQFWQSSNIGTDNYVAASVTPDKSLAVIYCAVAMSITIDQTKIATGYTATWVDPANGATQSATTGTTYASSGLGNNSAGNADWVLVLQGPPGVSVTAGLASGTGTAQGNDPAIGVNAAAATETGAALSPVAAAGVNAVPATEAGAALGAVPAVGVNAAAATEAGAALGATASTTTAGTASAGLASGTGATLNGTAAIGVTATAATEAGAALSPAVTTATSPAATAATGTGTAQGAAAAAAPAAALATGTGTAQGPAVAITVPAGLATGASTALNATASTTTAGTGGATAATGTGTALGATIAVAVTATLASGAGAALGATASTASAGTANAAAATGTGTAAAVTAGITYTAAATAATGTGAALGTAVASAASPAPAAAAGTGTALNGTAAIGVNAALATGTGTAQGATITATASPAAAPATGTGAALNATASTTTAGTANATLATGTGTAASAIPAVGAVAAAATEAGAALGATVSTASFTNAQAGLATGTGTALNPGLTLAGAAAAAAATGTGTTGSVPAIGVNAPVATGAGTARNATGQTGWVAPAGLAHGTGTAQSPVAVLVALAQPAAAAALGAALRATARTVDPFTVGALTTATAPAAALTTAAAGLYTLTAYDQPARTPALAGLLDEAAAESLTDETAGYILSEDGT